MATLPDLSAKTHEELLAIIEAQRTALAAKQAPGRLTFKVSPKGALAVYGMGQFPVTLYISQWERLWEATPALQAFAKANASTLTRKA